MKRQQLTLIFLVFLLLLGAWGIYAYFSIKPDVENVPNTVVVFERDSIGLGEMKYEDEKKAVFRFKNTGENPLLIRNAETACGCTTVEWNKRPVPPGNSGELTVTFKPNSLGRFMKEIRLICNVEDKVCVLRINGEVEE